MPDLQISNKHERFFYIDNLRIALTILVVIHHQSLLIFSMPLFLMINQAFFMGLFFFLSGCFTPASYDRKGMRVFLKDRFLRLGIPILIYIFVISPAAKICMSIYQQEVLGVDVIIPFTWKQYLGMTGIGPLWFLVMLLVFDICYILWRITMKKRYGNTAREYLTMPTIWAILLFVLALAFVTYLIRIIIPINTYILFFPSLAYLPQYLSFFIFGIMAYRRNWLQLLPNKLGKAGFIIAVTGTIVLFPVILSNLFGSIDGFIGGGTIKSGIYSLWDSLFSVGLCLGLLIFFRRHFNHQKCLGENLQKGCLTVYVIHSLIIIISAYMLYNLQIIRQVKLILASCISVPVCFLIAWLIGKIQIKAIVK